MKGATNEDLLFVNPYESPPIINILFSISGSTSFLAKSLAAEQCIFLRFNIKLG